nr:Tim44/TimA family putative adaptor protein [uncultured Celeribacter sp.]
MGNSLLSILVLAGIAIFLILRLRSVLGTREGFEKPRVDQPGEPMPEPHRARQNFEVIDGGVDHDINDNVKPDSPAAENMAAIKRVDPSFSVADFLNGARGAYEMILMAFEHDDLDSIKPFLSEEVFEAFSGVVASRQAEGLSIDSQFVGLREIEIISADLDRATDEAEITVRFLGETSSVVRNSAGEVVEGDPNVINRHKDIWTFARRVGSDDPNWLLVATGD